MPPRVGSHPLEHWSGQSFATDAHADLVYRCAGRGSIRSGEGTGGRPRPGTRTREQVACRRASAHPDIHPNQAREGRSGERQPGPRVEAVDAREPRRSMSRHAPRAADDEPAIAVADAWSWRGVTSAHVLRSPAVGRRFQAVRPNTSAHVRSCTEAPRMSPITPRPMPMVAEPGVAQPLADSLQSSPCGFGCVTSHHAQLYVDMPVRREGSQRLIRRRRVPQAPGSPPRGRSVPAPSGLGWAPPCDERRSTLRHAIPAAS